VKLAAGVGLAGVIAVLAVAGLLVAEKNRHADTRAELARQRELTAEVLAREATTAAEAARTVAAAAARATAELDAMRQHEEQLRAEAAEAARRSTENRAAADRQIARLRRENAELAAWADARVPGPWLDFMLGRGADTPAGAADGR
jgi:hypothetical protein